MEKLIRRKTLSELTYERLSDTIEEMQPEKNKLPSEEELAKMLGVSRATIREALKRLIKEGVITSLQGKGTFAHPSVFQADNRLDICSDLHRMLERSYQHVKVISSWNSLNDQSGNEPFLSQFGLRNEDCIVSDWLYLADNKKMFFVTFHFIKKFITKLPDSDSRYTSLLEFSEDCMEADIDCCIMTSQTKSSPYAADKFGLPHGTYFQCWDEKIYDIYDRLVGIAEIFTHPQNAKISVVTNFR